MNNDWFNLFVHQGRELIDSVSRKGKHGSNSSVITSMPRTSDEVDSRDKDMNDEDGRTNNTQSASEPSFEVPNPRKSGRAVTGAEKEVYETQLEQLQEQLVDLMIQNQEMATELDTLRKSDVAKLNKELEREQSRRKHLEGKLRKTNDESGTPKLRRRRHKGEKHSSALDSEPSEERDKIDKTDDISESTELETTKEQASRFKQVRLWIYGSYRSLCDGVMLMVWDIISDMADEETVAESRDVDGPALTVKRLKDNIRRFSCETKPISELFQKVNWIFSWNNPAATMMIFMGYLISVWHGYAISLVLFLAIVQLSANFVYSRFGSTSTKDEDEATGEPAASWSDKFQIVLHVAQKVQNFLGSWSDYLEKIKNLLTWKVPRITLKLYGLLWILFVVSLALNGQQLLTLTGLFLGYKMFITNPVYKRFPKLQKRYDTTLRLWNELPVDSELGGDGQGRELEESQLTTGPTTSSSSLSEGLAHSSKLFCERYELASDEVFVKGWEEGRRTSLMNKQKPLVNVKHGRLYLTQNYLCFERSRSHVERNILLKLSDIRSVKKYKPFFLLPGTGMSIEVYVREKEEPYIFGAILGRDEAYSDIIQKGKEAGLPWAI